jgi:hypothetical protein
MLPRMEQTKFLLALGDDELECALRAVEDLPVSA